MKGITLIALQLLAIVAKAKSSLPTQEESESLSNRIVVEGLISGLSDERELTKKKGAKAIKKKNPKNKKMKKHSKNAKSKKGGKGGSKKVKKKNNNKKAPPSICDSFLESGFDLRDASSGSLQQFFTEESYITLSQVGTYIGTDGIIEYVLFAFDNSPYINYIDYFLAETQFAAYGPDPALDDSDKMLCQYTTAFLDNTLLANGFAYDDEYITEVGSLIKVFWDPLTNTVDHIYVYYDDDFSNYFFSQLDTPQSQAFVCQTLLADHCAGVAAINNIATLEECLVEMAKLPSTENGYADGQSRACTYVHSVFAALNPLHCPHLSLTVPLEDASGKVKCKQSDFVQPSSLFTKNDFHFWKKFKKEKGFAEGTSMHYVGRTENNNPILCDRAFYLEDKDSVTCANLCENIGLVLDGETESCVHKKGKKGHW